MSKNLIVLYSDGKLNIDVEINVEQQNSLGYSEANGRVI